MRKKQQQETNDDQSQSSNVGILNVCRLTFRMAKIHIRWLDWLANASAHVWMFVSQMNRNMLRKCQAYNSKIASNWNDLLFIGKFFFGCWNFVNYMAKIIKSLSGQFCFTIVYLIRMVYGSVISCIKKQIYWRFSAHNYRDFLFFFIAKPHYIIGYMDIWHLPAWPSVIGCNQPVGIENCSQLTIQCYWLHWITKY